MKEDEVSIGDVLLKNMMILDAGPFADKDQLFGFIAEKFEENGIVSDKRAFKRSLLEREALGPTYMGNEIAIPHGKCKEVQKPGVGFVRCRDSFLYRSGDEEGPVRYIFALAVSEGQEDNSHLRILASLSGYLAKDEFLDLIAEVQSYEELLEGIKNISD